MSTPYPPTRPRQIAVEPGARVAGIQAWDPGLLDTVVRECKRLAFHVREVEGLSTDEV